ncbi:major capsid protein [Apis mellifera associated microvirus 41]|nr:major capsid protein [Apis mellifera associated microvirus 41]
MKRSKFSLSHYKLLSCDMGELIPCGLQEVLPGDTFQQSTSILVRASPLLAPVMHPVHVRIHHWFVPHRLVWEDWEEFITGGPDGMDDSVFPTITAGGSGYPVGSLSDYLGVPPGVANLEHSALPHRGYGLIWNEWYRDQDLQSEVFVDKTSGPDANTSVALQNVGWEKDYFTSARPWEQKGPTISIPVGGAAPVTGSVEFLTNSTVRTVSATGGTSGARGMEIPATNNPDTVMARLGADAEADLSGASAVNVNILREALALQRYEEARARYGSRYVEYLRYLGVRSSDARLQRPEYLGGGQATIQFSEVLQTAEGTNPVGELRGHGIGTPRSNRYRKFFEEHGYIHTFVSVRPKTIYANGLFRHWNRRTKEDFWQRELQHIGQQEVLNKEVYAASASPDDVFGFQDRYDEYRRTESSIGGEFRTTLDFWHMARIFSSSPALNADFVKSVPTERTFAVPSEDVLWLMARHNIQARRMVAAQGHSYIF